MGEIATVECACSVCHEVVSCRKTSLRMGGSGTIDDYFLCSDCRDEFLNEIVHSQSQPPDADSQNNFVELGEGQDTSVPSNSEGINDVNHHDSREGENECATGSTGGNFDDDHHIECSASETDNEVIEISSDDDDFSWIMDHEIKTENNTSNETSTPEEHISSELSVNETNSQQEVNNYYIPSCDCGQPCESFRWSSLCLLRTVLMMRKRRTKMNIDASELSALHG